MSTVVVSGAIANKPLNGGSVWERMSWAVGLRRLGFRVVFIEQLRRDACVGADCRPADFRASLNLEFFQDALAGFTLDGAGLFLDQGEDSYGLPWQTILEIAETAELLVDIGGHLDCETLLRRFRRKVLVDVDPGFTQIWHATGAAGVRLDRYDVHFTIAENIGTGSCTIPTGEIRWLTTRQPVVLADWPAGPADSNRFTTVASWRGPYGSVEYGGHSFALKHHQWRRLAELPTRTPFRFEAALAIDPADRRDLELLERHGWVIVDPYLVAGDAAGFRRYVGESGAEFSVAQGVYVDTNSGWFSDRTARYLASGKPVLVQDTGFARTIPSGEGIVPFRTLEEAVEGAGRIMRDYSSHGRAARTIAEEYFDSDAVLSRFLNDVGI